VGSCDQEGVYSNVAARHPEAAVIVPPRSTAVPGDTGRITSTEVVEIPTPVGRWA